MMPLTEMILPKLEKQLDKIADKSLKILKEETHEYTGLTRDSEEVKKTEFGGRLVWVNPEKLINDPRNLSRYYYTPAYYHGRRALGPQDLKKARAFSWIDKKTGKRIHARRIRATKGDKFVDRAVQRVKKEVL